METQKEATQYIEYLKAENRILRSKLPKRVEVTQAERAILVKFGEKLGSAIKELITIVHLLRQAIPRRHLLIHVVPPLRSVGRA